MGLKKVAEPSRPPCLSPGHNPPQHISLPAGTYEHTCDACGSKQTFTVTRPVH